MLKVVDGQGVLLMPAFAVAVAVVVLLLFCFFSIIGLFAKKGFEGMGSDLTIASIAPGKGGFVTEIARSGRSELGYPAGSERFFGRPEAPVFYEIGDTELVRADRKHEGVDKFEGMGDYKRWQGFEGLNLDDALRGR